MIIVCSCCGAPIYDCAAIGRNFTGAKIRAEDFTPLGDWENPANGEDMLCPICGKGFVFDDNGTAILKTENGLWWPHPPVEVKK